jgi:hypothetical protein
MIPAEQNVPVSTFIFTHEDGWMQLEHRVQARDRAHHRMPHGTLVKACPRIVCRRMGKEQFGPCSMATLWTSRSTCRRSPFHWQC